MLEITIPLMAGLLRGLINYTELLLIVILKYLII